MVVWSKPGSVIAAWGDIPDLLLCGEDVHTGVLFPHQIKNLIGISFCGVSEKIQECDFY